jgi:4-amino-4-deoxy-L-arabinose transferase-like glycosyltransferase
MLLNSQWSRSIIEKITLNLAAPFLLVTLAFLYMPIKQTFEFDFDEGLNLMKAFLYYKGFPLYTSIWSDQPPLLTYILAIWFRVFGPSIFASRLLILLFSCILIYCFQQILQQLVGKIPALLSSLFLIASWSYLKLSVSVMIGLPSLALAVLSLYCITAYQQKNNRWLIILSGCLFALSLQIKLFTIILIPLLILLLFGFRIQREQNEKIIRAIIDSLIWLFSLGLTYFITGILLNSFNYEQLLEAHVGGNIEEEFTSNGLKFMLNMFYKDRFVVCLAVLGTITASFKKRWDVIFPLTWLLTAMLVLINHKPVWYHHYLLVSIPMVWLSAYGVLFALNFIKNQRYSNFTFFDFDSIKTLILPSLAILLVVVSVVAIPIKLSNPGGRPSPQWELVDLLKKHSEETKWVFSDRPIIPLYAQLPIPPEVAVLSQKRFVSGNFSYDKLLDVLEKYRPEQIVLTRRLEEIKGHSKISQFLANEYRKTYSKTRSKSDTSVVAEHYLRTQISAE